MDRSADGCSNSGLWNTCLGLEITVGVPGRRAVEPYERWRASHRAEVRKSNGIKPRRAQSARAAVDHHLSGSAMHRGGWSANPGGTRDLGRAVGMGTWLLHSGVWSV